MFNQGITSVPTAIPKKAAPIEEKYARANAKSKIREALLFNEAIEGATNPKMISGTRKKITCPLICLTGRMIFMTGSPAVKPNPIPTATARSNCTTVFFITFFILSVSAYKGCYHPTLPKRVSAADRSPSTKRICIRAKVKPFIKQQNTMNVVIHSPRSGKKKQKGLPMRPVSRGVAWFTSSIMKLFFS